MKMPELNQVIEKKQSTAPVKATAKPIEATVIEEEKKSSKIKQTVKPEVPKVPAKQNPVSDTPKSAPVKSEKKPEVEAAANEVEDEKHVRPPIEQIVRDFDAHVESLSLAGQKIKKLGYKCGKIIFGLAADGTGKDFRVIAYKARKKTKSVSGKSRVIFYFGINKETKKHVKEILGTSSSKFGRCSVQISDPIEPIEFKLDKTIFSETFDKDVTKVMDSLKKLCAITIEQKSSVFEELKEKKEKKDTAAE
jgi:hypothetical protein